MAESVRGRALGTVLLAGLTLLSAAGATGYLLRPVAAPRTLQNASQVTSAQVGREELTDERTVKISLIRSAPPPLVIGVGGRVTATSCAAGRPLRSGQAAARVGDAPLIALSTSTPLYRDLDRGDKGRDVRALKRELTRLGYRTGSGGVYDRRTAAAVRKLQRSVGVTRPDGAITAGEILWLPAPSVVPDSCDVVQGGYVSSGQRYATTAARLTAVVVQSMPSNAVAGDRVMELMGVTGPLTKDGTATDAAFLAKVADTHEYRLAASADEQPELTAVIALRTGLQTVKVPPGSLFGVVGDRGCVQSGAAAYAVRIVGSRLGATLVIPRASAGDLPARVNLGSSITLSSCG